MPPARTKFVRDGRLVDPPFAERAENQPLQSLEPMVIRNGAIYLSRSHVIEQGSFKGRRSFALLMPAHRSVNIDEWSDLHYLRWLLNCSV